MRLLELNPEYKTNEDGGYVGIVFDCPKCREHRIGIPTKPSPRGWDIAGKSFEDLTISPSIAHDAGCVDCRTHFFIRDGKIIEA